MAALEFMMPFCERYANGESLQSVKDAKSEAYNKFKKEGNVEPVCKKPAMKQVTEKPADVPEPEVSEADVGGTGKKMKKEKRCQRRRVR